MAEEKKIEEKKDSPLAWLVRFLKGAVIGTGAILPGVSGGVLSIVFGIYEKMMAFFANLGKNFVKNLLFFLPIGLGWVGGVIALSKTIEKLMTNPTYAPILIWFFIGAIVGTLPMLFKQSAEKGRKPVHWVILAVTAVAAFLIMVLLKGLGAAGDIAPNFFWWIFCGVMTALGAILPGMSPSSILIYMGLYDKMTGAIGNLDIAMLIPFAIGMVGAILLFSKLVHFLFKKYHAVMYHIIIGIVIASTVMIIPLNWVSALNMFFCVISCAGGLAISFLLGKLEEKVR